MVSLVCGLCDAAIGIDPRAVPLLGSLVPVVVVRVGTMGMVVPKGSVAMRMNVQPAGVDVVAVVVIMMHVVDVGVSVDERQVLVEV